MESPPPRGFDFIDLGGVWASIFSNHKLESESRLCRSPLDYVETTSLDSDWKSLSVDYLGLDIARWLKIGGA